MTGKHEAALLEEPCFAGHKEKWKLAVADKCATRISPNGGVAQERDVVETVSRSPPMAARSPK